MNWQPLLERWAYPTVFIASAVEGEIVFVAASVLVAVGKLNVVGVLLAGASAGDQFFYYLFRGRMSSWVNRIPWLARRREAVTVRVHQHATKMILASRFLPGMRISIPLACAYAGISPFRFTVLNVLNSLAWAIAVMFIVAYLGPSILTMIGVGS